LRSYGGLKSQDLGIFLLIFLLNFCVFWKSDPLRENFRNSVPKGFIAKPNNVLCSNCVKFDRREIGEVVRYLPDKKNKISPRSPALASTHIAPKICQSQPRTMYSECSRFYSNRFNFGGVIAERVNAIETRRKVIPIFGWSLSSSRIIICMWLHVLEKSGSQAFAQSDDDVETSFLFQRISVLIQRFNAFHSTTVLWRRRSNDHPSHFALHGINFLPWELSTGVKK